MALTKSKSKLAPHLVGDPSSSSPCMQFTSENVEVQLRNLRNV